MAQKVNAVDGNTLSADHARVHAQKGGKRNPVGAQLATTLFAATFSAQSSIGYTMWNTTDWNSFMDQYNQRLQNGLTLTSVNVFTPDESTTWYLGSWTQVSGGNQALWVLSDWPSFMTYFDQQKPSSRLLDFAIYATGGTRWILGTFGGTPASQTIVSDLSWNDFSTQWSTLSNQGMRLTKIQVDSTEGAAAYSGLFEQGDGGYALLSSTDWNGFYQYYQSNPGMQLTDYQIHDENGSRFYVGVWNQTSNTHKFIFDQDWGSFVNQWNEFAAQGLYLSSAIQYPNAVETPEPQWEQFFQNALGTTAEGYCFYVLCDGQIAAQGVNNARSAKDTPQESWSLDSRSNLASVSKSVTAVAVLKLLGDLKISIDDTFYSLVKGQFPTVGPGVDKVTIRNLLQMKSGMTPDGTLYTDNIWTFLSGYLAAQNVPDGAPGNVEAYSNTNFTILQALIDALTGHGGDATSYYPTYVTENVLKPMGIDPSVFNATPDAQSSSTLYYSGASDPNNGIYFNPINCIAAGGWISSARQLIKFLAGVRSNTVLGADTTLSMLENNLGWYTYNGLYGQYFHHNGGLVYGNQGLVTGIIHLSDSYDALLLINSWGPDTIGLMIQAFEQRLF